MTLGTEVVDTDPKSIDGGRCAAWPLVIVLVVVTALLYGATSIGAYVPDNRMVQFWNPSKGLSNALSTWSQLNLGRVHSAQGLVMLAYSTSLDWLGMPPWLIQRTFHVSLVSVGAIGAAMVARDVLGRSLLGPMVAGLWWITSTFTIGFMVPSALYLNAAVAPWLFLAWSRGTTTPSRWRWAGVFALAVAVAGFTNPPGLVLAALPLLPLAVYQLWTGQASWRSIGNWLIRVVPLLGAVSAFDLYRLRRLAGTLAENLESSESAATANFSSSWSESVRGLGRWLHYWNDGDNVVNPWLLSYFTNPVVILLTFVPVVVVVGVVAIGRWPPGVLFGGILVLSTTVMVGLHPIGRSSPYGRVLDASYDVVPWMFGFRNSYKAGVGWLLATSVLLGAAATWLGPRIRNRAPRPRSQGSARERLNRVTAIAGASLIGAAAVAASSPAWSGELFSRSDSFEEIPPYWLEAIEWLDDQDSPTRVLVLPGWIGHYRWGNASNGDLFATFLERPYILDSALGQTSPTAFNAINAVSDRMSMGDHLPGSLGEIARRLGIGHVVIRNDTVWEMGVARPAHLDVLRADPAMTLVAAFGAPGENVVRPGESVVEVFREAELPPVEIYEIVDRFDPVDPVRAVSSPSLLVSGDGAAWPALAASGALDGGNPIRYTPQLSITELRHELERGAPVVITDTNRRRATSWITNSVGVLADEPGRALFARSGSESVLRFADAVRITDLSPSPLLDPGPAWRPAAAFDGSDESAFLTGAFRPLAPLAGLRVDLREPTVVDTMELMGVRTPGLRQVSRVEIVLSTGDRIPAEISDGIATVELGGRAVSWFEVRVTAITGTGAGAWGFHRIDVPGLDLREMTQVPDDLARVADVAPDIMELVGEAPLTYRFERVVRGGRALETSLLRRFRTPTERSFVGSGTIRIGDALGDHQLAELLELSTFGVSNARLTASPASSALRAFDGRDDTAWEFDPRGRADLVVSFPEQMVSSVDVIVDVGADQADVVEVDLSVAGVQASSRAERPDDCAADDACLVTVTVEAPEPVESTGLTLLIGAPDASRDGSPQLPAEATRSVRVIEVLVNGQANPPFPISVPETCHESFASIDERPIEVRLFAPPDALFDGRPIAVDLCAPVDLAAGWHTFRSGTAAPFSTLDLLTGPAPTAPARPATEVSVERRGDTTVIASVVGPPGTAVISGIAPSPLWRAEVDGHDLGEPITMDAQMAWVLPGGGTATVEMSISATWVSNVLAVLFLLGIVACVAIAVVDPRSGAVSAPARRFTRTSRSSPPITAIAAVTIALAFGIAGLGGLALAGAVWWLHARRILVRRLLGWMAVALMLLAAIATVPPRGPELTPVTPQWPDDRLLAWHSARLAAVLLLVSISMMIADRAGAANGTPEAEASPTMARKVG